MDVFDEKNWISFFLIPYFCVLPNGSVEVVASEKSGAQNVARAENIHVLPEGKVLCLNILPDDKIADSCTRLIWIGLFRGPAQSKKKQRFSRSISTKQKHSLHDRENCTSKK